MDKLENFKEIADEIMSDINAGEELKSRTFKQCTGKKQFAIGRVLIPAACLLIAVGFFDLSGILPQQAQKGKEESSQISLLADADRNEEALPESTAAVQDNAYSQNRALNSIEEAKESFGSSFLNPEFIPDGYTPKQIQAYGLDESTVDRVELSYASGDNILLISQNKSEAQEELQDYSTIFINGISGYIKSAAAQDNKNAKSPFTELHWYNHGVHYSISGNLNEETALKVAEAMK